VGAYWYGDMYPMTKWDYVIGSLTAMPQYELLFFVDISLSISSTRVIRVRFRDVLRFSFSSSMANCTC
jgi:hypothetical protein